MSPHIDFLFHCIDKVVATNSSGNLDKLLITKEAYWSAQLFTLATFGLNKRQEVDFEVESNKLQSTSHLSHSTCQLFIYSVAIQLFFFHNFI